MRRTKSTSTADHDTMQNAGTETPARDFLQGFANGLTVIRSFGPQRPSMTLSEVAKVNNLSRAATRRILLTMKELGFIETNGREFRLRPKVLDLGYAYLSSVNWLQIAQPIVEDIVAKTQMPCNGSVLEHEDIIYVLRVSTRVGIRADLAISIGRRFPAYLTGMGRVLLGGLPAADLDAYLAKVRISPLTPHTVSKVDELRERIEMSRSQGWSFVNQEHAHGICSLGVPLHDRQGSVFAALGIGWVIADELPEATRDRLLPQLMESAAEIDRLLRMRNI